MKERCPRIMLVAPASGSGKTLITCGILQALVNRNLKVSSFKCGPDYIDPMFHSRIIGAKSKNLDSFFTDANTMRFLFGDTAKCQDISVIEGVMGFYDGLGGTSLTSSSYEVSETLNAPVILIVDAYGSSTTVAAVIKGLKDFRKNNIKGVILNRISEKTFDSIKEMIEKETGVKTIGYVPIMNDLVLESRHLGLVLPDEIVSLKNNLNKMAKRLEETLDIDSILDLANSAEDVEYIAPDYHSIDGHVKIAVASDDAFCFTYEDNINLLKKMGAEIVTFSPMNDSKIPNDVDGLILSGGYPELHADILENNKTMLDSIKTSLENGMPCIAECGGFMYLNEVMEDDNGKMHKMVGFLHGKCFKTERLVRFGYITLNAKNDNLMLKKDESLKGHEFHYWDCTDNHGDCIAKKAYDGEEYDCELSSDTLFVGFPHTYLYSNPNAAFKFLTKCSKYRKDKR